MRNAIVNTGVFLLLAIFLAVTAVAAPLKWTLQDVIFNDGAVASGSFVYDAATNQYSSVDIEVDPPVDAGWEQAYSFVCATCELQPPSATGVMLLADAATSDLRGAQVLLLAFGNALTDAGGTVVLGRSAENLCATSTCSILAEIGRSVSAGSVDARAQPVVAAPSLSPTMLLILAIVLAVAAFRVAPRLRRRDL